MADKDKFRKPKPSWAKKTFLNGIGLGNLANPDQSVSRPRSSNKTSPTSLQSKQPVGSTIPKNGEGIINNNQSEPNFNQPRDSDSFGKTNNNNAGPTNNNLNNSSSAKPNSQTNNNSGTGNEGDGNSKLNNIRSHYNDAKDKINQINQTKNQALAKAGQINDAAHHPVEAAKNEIKRRAAKAVREAVKEAAKQIAKEAVAALLEATSEIWVPILLIIIAVIAIIIGLVFFLKAAQHPSPSGTSQANILDTTKSADETLAEKINGLAGQYQNGDQNIDGLLNAAEIQINTDLKNIKSDDKNYQQVQKLGKQGLDLISTIRTENKTPCQVTSLQSGNISLLTNELSLASSAFAQTKDNTCDQKTKTIRSQLTQLSDILSQLSGLTTLLPANCPHKPLLEYGIAPAASDAMQCVGVSLKYARPSQTVGTKVAASAGTHAAEAGQTYSAATDLSARGLSDDQVRDLIAKLDSVGFAAFYRPFNWDGKGGVRHMHIVYLGVPMKAILQRQVKDYVNGRDGLGCHCHAYTFYQPPDSVKQMATLLFKKNNPGFTL